jgi:basic membrane protein A and related proteins
MYKNLIGAALCVAAVMSPGARAQTASNNPAAPPLKVAFVYVSPVGEAGWSFQHEQGRLAMQAALGATVQSTRVEAVPEGADAERVMRDLARQGHGLIFATSFGYLEPALRVAAEFPQVRFEHAGGYKQAPNLNTYNARYYEGRYLAGMAAGAASKSGVAGYVAGFPLPEVVQGINAFARGMREINPRAEVRVLWLNAWFDPPREREAAHALVNQGADVLANHSGSPAVPLAAEERGVKLAAYQSDMRRYAPKAQLTSVLHQWGPYYTAVVKAVQSGRWVPTPVWGGMRDGFIEMAPLSADVPAAAVALIKEREAQIRSGRFHPFSGSVRDREGRQRWLGNVMSDAALAEMNWFVPGVVGTLPADK